MLAHSTILLKSHSAIFATVKLNAEMPVKWVLFKFNNFYSLNVFLILRIHFDRKFVSFIKILIAWIKNMTLFIHHHFYRLFNVRVFMVQISSYTKLSIYFVCSFLCFVFILKKIFSIAMTQ
jgi:hypothetical protein